MTFQRLWRLVKQTGLEFWNDNAMRLGAALSFFTALSLSPLLLIVISIASLAFGEQAARGELVAQLRDLMGEEGARMIETMLAAGHQKSAGVWATIVGFGTLLVGATGVFAQLQDALNTVWNTEKRSAGSGIWTALKDRLLSFSMVCGMAFLLLVSLVVSAVLSSLKEVIQQWLPAPVEVFQAINFAISLCLMFLLFAMIFKVLPNASLRWSDVWIGAAITTILFAIGRYLISLYLGHAAVGSTFGAAGSFVVLLLWLYYSSLILLFGAEFTQVYSTAEGSGVSKSTDVSPDGEEKSDKTSTFFAV